jgi:hypothetical protein
LTGLAIASTPSWLCASAKVKLPKNAPSIFRVEPLDDISIPAQTGEVDRDPIRAER